MAKSRWHLQAEQDPCLTCFCNRQGKLGKSDQGLCYGMGLLQEGCCTSTQKKKTNPKLQTNLN